MPHFIIQARIEALIVTPMISNYFSLFLFTGLSVPRPWVAPFPLNRYVDVGRFIFVLRFASARNVGNLQYHQ